MINEPNRPLLNKGVRLTRDECKLTYIKLEDQRINIYIKIMALQKSANLMKKEMIKLNKMWHDNNWY